MCAAVRPQSARDTGRARLIAQPEPNWVPLRAGPFRYQSTSRPFRHSDLSPAQIMDFVRGQFTDNNDFVVGVDEDSYCFEVSRPGTYALYLYPSEARKHFDAEYKDSCAQRDGFVEKIEAIWREMERRFRLAHRLGKFSLIARVGSPMAAQFTEIPADVFSLYEVVDWQRGVGREPGGDHIYAIHVAPRSGDNLPPTRLRETGAMQSLSNLKKNNEDDGEETVPSIAPNFASSDVDPSLLAKNRELPLGDSLAYSVKEAVKVSGVGRSKIYEAMRSKELRAKKHGKRTLILAHDLAAWLDELPSK